MAAFDVGTGVSVTDGPMEGIYGVVVWISEEQDKYLVRFSGSQQLFYQEEQIVLWDK